MSEVVILENKEDSKLFKDRFIHEDKTYLISDMKNAVMKSGWFPDRCMEVTFKDQTKRDFAVGTVSTSYSLNALFSCFMVDTMSQDIKTPTQQWVTAINTLIAMNSS